jgi:hypothetical protein
MLGMNKSIYSAILGGSDAIDFASFDPLNITLGESSRQQLISTKFGK